MRLKNPSTKLTALTGLTFLSAPVLAASFAYADDSIVDQINVTVPVSCNISGTGMTSHNADIQNGTYTANIGTTTLHAFCNDNEGLAIYAAGYTGNEIGGTNSNKLVGTSASGNATIESGLATSAGNPDVSNWAMKLAITQDSGDTTGTNAFTIDSAPNVALPSQAEQGATSASFSSYHVVPNEYVKVAHKNSATDMTESTGGVKLTTTYAAYISKTQPADTYSGQVIYTLVHPVTMVPILDNQVGIIFDGNGSYFDQAGTKSKNAVIYDMSEVGTGEYIATTPTIVKTPNLANDGTKNTSYDETERIVRTLSFDGASKIKVDLTYGVSGNYYVVFAPGEHDFNESWPGLVYSLGGGMYCDEFEDYCENSPDEYHNSGNKSFTLESDTISISIDCYDNENCESDEGYDYGFYFEIYPIYDNESPGTVEIMKKVFTPISGAYADTTDNRAWVLDSVTPTQVFSSDSTLIQYISDNFSLFAGDSIVVHAEEKSEITVKFYGNGVLGNTVVYGCGYFGCNAVSGMYSGPDHISHSSCNDAFVLYYESTYYGFQNESELKSFLEDNRDSLSGTEIELEYSLPFC